MTPLVMLVSGALFFAGSLFPQGSAMPGTALALMLALGPVAGIVAQVRDVRLLYCSPRLVCLSPVAWYVCLGPARQGQGQGRCSRPLCRATCL